MGPYRTLGASLLGSFRVILLGTIGVIVGEGETPIWDPIGTFGVGPIRDIVGDGGDPIATLLDFWGRPYWGHSGGGGEIPIWDPIGTFGVGPIRDIEGDGGDPIAAL